MKKNVSITVVLLFVTCLFVSSVESKRQQTALVAAADLSVSKVDTPDPVNTGSHLTYSITVTNNGPGVATNASWSDTLPAGTTFVSQPGVGGWSCSTPDAGNVGTVTCSNPSFAVGSAVFTLTVAVAPTVPAGSTLTNTATATSSTSDGNPGNNSGQAMTTVLSPATVTGLKSRSGGTTPGTTVDYLIILSNSSGSDQQDNPGNEFTDPLPAGLTLVSAAASAGTATANIGTNTVTWNGVVPASDSVTISISATINAGTTGMSIANTGAISYDADGNGTNEASGSTNTDTFMVGAPTFNADLSVVKVASADTISADSDLSYTITVNNGGPDTATSATLTDPLTGNLTFVSLSPPAGWTCAPLTPGAGGTLSCSRDLPFGSGPQVFTLVTHVPSGTPDGTFYNNEASVSTTATDPTSENNAASAGTVVGCVTAPFVTSNADSGPGSLRQAIKDACSGSTITFSSSLVSPITLTSGELSIDKNLTITGPGANLLTVQRSSAGATPRFRIFDIGNTAVTINISGLTISNGRTADGTGAGSGDEGGGILIGPGAALNLKNVAVTGNQTGVGGSSGTTGAGGNGGGVSNRGSLTLVNSTISGNQTGAGGSGSGGFGGGIYNSGDLTVVNSTISGNQAGAGGNGSGGAGTGGGGGGIYANNFTLNLISSTISNNQTGAGGTGAAGSGGGVNNNLGTANVKNTIIAGNSLASGGTGADFLGALNSQDYNLIESILGATITGTTTHNITGTSANLGALANNGGPTQTMLPSPTSPVINAGDSGSSLSQDTLDADNDTNTGEQLPVDQRGFARVAGANFDIGAVETNYVITPTAGTPQSTNVNTAFATNLKATVTESGVPLSGVQVTFTAPGSGPSGSFPGPSTTATVATNISGQVTAPTFTANAIGGAYNVVASIGPGVPTANFALTNNKLNQTITFAQPADKTFGNADFPVTATATSNLAVSFAASGNCTVSGTGTGTVHLTGAGSCTITASQGGDATYNAAANVVRTFNILKAATTTAVTSSVNPSNPGQSVTLTATVTSAAGTPTGTVQFKDNGVNLGSPQTLDGSGVATLTTSTLTTGVHPITADYSGDANFSNSTGTLSGGQVVGVALVFSAAAYNTTESSRAVTITVQRLGDSSQAVTVDYATPDDSAATPTILPCSTAGFVSPRCDFTSAAGTLRFAAGDTSKTFDILISQDNYVEGTESFALTLSNPTNGAVLGPVSTANVVITDDVTEPVANPIDDSTNFVRQHYHDFLNREPDPSDLAGLNFWVNQIESCGADQACRDLRRTNVSASFFLSIEFQQTGYYVYRTYKTAFGDINPPTVPVPVRYTEFTRDSRDVQNGVIVGQGSWQAQLDANKQAYALAFVQRASFLARYPALTSATAYVDTMNANTGGVLVGAERNQLIAELSPNPTDPALRASVLMKIAENATLKNQESNKAFVLMQYFGYLRRNPDAAPEPGLNFNGYNFWLAKLNQFNGNFVNADMVKAFITSSEYRKRSGQ